LHSFFNHLLKKLAGGVEQHDGVKQFRQIIQSLVRLRNDDCGQCFEMRWPITQIDTCVSNINQFVSTFFVLDNFLEMSSR